ncbi:MAG: benzoyl-CoA reductase, bzd-type, subunit O [Proteobacteria bacterium]|nr:benzoyl-CoA reductase, bzd-type, subunit O [Pseudomonadota bacterium]
MGRYPTEPLKCWKKAKELRNRFYQNYARAGEKGGLRWMGSAWAFDAVPSGLGEDVFCISGESYGAACAFDRPLSKKFLEAARNFGFSRDLCAHMRNYWGSLLADESAFGGKFVKPDFGWSQHICCSHAKWYQNAAQMKGGVPIFVVDVGVGAYPPFEPKMYPHRIKYVADQLLDGIEWLTATTGRKFDDERFINAAWNDLRSTHKWAQICMLNRAKPAPLDEKFLYSFYVFGTLQKSNSEFADFYDELYDEVKDRVDRGIAAVHNERFRVMSDIGSPWGFSDIYKRMADQGVVSIGSLYTFGLEGMWLYDAQTHDLRPRPLPDRKPGTREECCTLLADWHLSKPMYQHFYHPDNKTRMMDAIARRWDTDGIVLHYNRGCRGLCMGIAETRLALIERGHRVVAYEGNMGDENEFDQAATRKRLDIFMEGLGCKIN